MRFIHEKILRLRGMMKLGTMCCHADGINYLDPEKHYAVDGEKDYEICGYACRNVAVVFRLFQEAAEFRPEI